MINFENVEIMTEEELKEACETKFEEESTEGFTKKVTKAAQNCAQKCVDWANDHEDVIIGFVKGVMLGAIITAGMYNHACRKNTRQFQNWQNTLQKKK